jgi:hypothetical protein
VLYFFLPAPVQFWFRTTNPERGPIMQQYEKIPVWVKVINGVTLCICRKGCDHREHCEREYVFRDRFRGWEQTMMRDRYGR